MTAINQNVVHWAGDTRLIRIVVKDEAGDPVDLTSATVRWWLAKFVTSTGDNILVQKATEGHGIEIDHPNSFWRVLITLDAADTEGLPPGKWYHECEVVLASGAISTVAIGKFEIKSTLIPDVLP
jgi:hypothetical protein